MISSTEVPGQVVSGPTLGRAIVMQRFGPPDVLELKQVETPRPRDNEVLVRVLASSVNRGDLIARTFGTTTAREFSMPTPLWLVMRNHFGTRAPRVRTLGSEFSGVIEAVGHGVTAFAVGESVFGTTGLTMGTHADYVCVPEGGAIAVKPAALTHAEAATAAAGTLTALRLLRRVELRRGSRVLVLGASGGIGSAAVQIAKNVYGARVTGVGGPKSLDYIRTLGAEAAYDYTTFDPGITLERYDLVIDVLGRGSFSRLRHLLERRGVYLYVSFKTRHLLQMVVTRILGGKRVLCVLAGGPADDMARVADLLASGTVKSIVDRCFPLAQVARAHEYVESGRKAGHVAVQVGADQPCQRDARGTS